MKKYSILVVLLPLLLCNIKSANGWGREGHKIVVQIALSFLDSATKEKVKLSIDNMTAEQAGNWMDDMRSDKRYDYMKHWHYVNVEKGETYDEKSDDNVIFTLNKVIKELENKGKMKPEDIKKDVLIICHLTGDMHQPLHVGYGVDYGGNKIQVKYLKSESNLHKVWDSEIIESEHIKINDCLLHLSSFDKSMIERLKVINIENWMRQPRQQLSSVYDFKDNKIDQDYIDRNKKIIEEELLIAGIRLSAIFEKIFKA